MRLLIACLVFGVGSASAEPAYPLEVVDRPLVLLGGMTTLDVSEDLSHPNGWDNELDLGVAHAFGPVQVSARTVGIVANGTVSIPLSAGSAISLGFDYDTPQRWLAYGYGQSLGYTYRALAVPHRLALYAHVHVGMFEESLTPSDAPSSAGTGFDAVASVASQLQLTRRLAVDGGVTMGVPLGHSSSLMIDPRTTFGAYVEATFSFRRWDLYANLGLADMTRQDRQAGGSLGFLHRWGV